MSIADLTPSTFLILITIGISLLLLIYFQRWRVLKARQTASIDLKALSELGSSITITPANLEDLAEVAYVEAIRFLEIDVFQIGLFEADRYRTIIWIKDGRTVDNEEFAFTSLPDIFNEIRDSNQPSLVGEMDDRARPTMAQFFGKDHASSSSGMFVPLLIGEEAIGIISILSRKKGIYTGEDLHILTLLANTLAGPIALSLLNSEIDYVKNQVGINEAISRVLASPMSLEMRLSEIVPMILQSGEYLGTCFYEYREGALHPLAQAPESYSRWEIDDALIHRVVETGTCESRYFKTLKNNIEEHNQAQQMSLSELAIPVATEEQIFGVLQILQPGLTPFSTLQRSQAEAIAANIALAVLESRVNASQQEENWFTTVLLEVARHASQPGDMDAALQAVLQLTTILTGTDWALLFVRERNDPMMRMGPSAGIGRQTQLMLSDVRISLDALGFSSDDSVGVPIAIELPDPLSSLLETGEATAMSLGSPEDHTGVFIMEGREIPERQMSLIQGIANQISLRLENYKLIEEIAARRSLERELETARTIQHSFLPKEKPDLNGWEIGVYWNSARQVGGDFYDFLPLADGPDGKRWGIVIADVTDKGIPAALFMALCRTLLRSVAINRIDPGSTLTRLNELLFADTQAELLVSLIYAVWEPEVARLSFANAGHNPPLLFRRYQRAEILAEHDIVLGADLDASYNTQSIEIDPRELIVFYTDGVTEVMDTSGEMFGIHRLENLVLGLKEWSGQGIADRISTRVADFSGTYELPDDLTTVVLYRQGSK